MLLRELPILSPVAILVSALVFAGLERIFPYNRSQRLFREEFWTDLVGYGVVQSYLMGLVISSLVYAIQRHAGFLRWAPLSHWPILVQLIFFLVTHDLNTYLIHRCQHRFRWLWRTHEAHH